MKQKELVHQIALSCAEAGYPVERRAIETVLDALARAASKAVGEGDEVTIPGLVKLSTKERAARDGRDPNTGAPIAIAAKTVVVAKPLKALSDHVSG